MTDGIRALIIGVVGGIIGLIVMFGLVSSQSSAETVKQPGVVYGQTTPLVK
jgi:hypothetical protein